MNKTEFFACLAGFNATCLEKEVVKKCENLLLNEPDDYDNLLDGFMTPAEMELCLPGTSVEYRFSRVLINALRIAVFSVRKNTVHCTVRGDDEVTRRVPTNGSTMMAYATLIVFGFFRVHCYKPSALASRDLINYTELEQAMLAGLQAYHRYGNTFYISPINRELQVTRRKASEEDDDVSAPLAALGEKITWFIMSAFSIDLDIFREYANTDPNDT